VTSKEAYHSLVQHLPFAPTKGQEGFLYKLSEFLTDDDKGKVFLLRGYAGTGKTSMVTSVVTTLKLMRKKYALLAPTGRAAKVLAGYSRQRAFTIHKFIYQMVTDEFGNVKFALRLNTGKKAVIIVDEASMIAAQVQASKGRIQSRDLICRPHAVSRFGHRLQAHPHWRQRPAAPRGHGQESCVGGIFSKAQRRI
jgi:exodeoxyribonuclease-5